MATLQIHAKIMQRRFALRDFLVCSLVFFGYVAYDYYHSLDLRDAKLVRIVDDKDKPDCKVLVFSTLSNYPAYPFIPDKVRRFFGMQPLLCFVTPDGQLFMDNYVSYPCYDQENDSEKVAKSHEMESSEFAIALYTTADKFDKTQLLYKTMMKQHGMWVKLRLMGLSFGAKYP